MDTPIIDNEPQNPGREADDVIGSGIETHNWKRLGSLCAGIIRGRRWKMRRYMIDEGVSATAIRRVLSEPTPGQAGGVFAETRHARSGAMPAIDKERVPRQDGGE